MAEVLARLKIGLSDEDKQKMVDEIYNKVNDETQKELVEMHETIQSFGQLRPAGTDISTNILNFKQDKGVYVATDNGYWYYWNGSAYVYGGVYQATEIADGSITPEKTTFIDTNVLYENELIEVTSNNQAWITKRIDITSNFEGGKIYTLLIDEINGVDGSLKFIFRPFDSEGSELNSLNYYNDATTITNVVEQYRMPENTAKVTLIFHVSNENAYTGTAQFKNVRFVKGTEKKQVLSNDIDIELKDNSISPVKTSFIDKVLSDNLIYLENKERTIINGVTYSIKNGVITLNGTATGDINLWLPLEQTIPSGTKSMLSSYTYKSSNNFNVNNFWYAKGYEDWDNRGQFNDTQTFTTEYDITFISVYIPTNTSVDEYVFKPMIVSGDVIPSEFKPSVKYILNSSINLEQDLDYKSLFKLKNKYRYLTLTFYGTDSKGLILLGTNNLKTFDLVSQKGKYITLNYVENNLQNTLRDPSIIQIQDYYYIVYTIIGFETGSNKIGLCRTKDFESFEELDNLGITNVSNTYNQIWSPNWFRDEDNVYILGTCRKTGTENRVTTINKYNVNTHTLESGVELNFDGIDYHLYKENGVYYAFGGGGKVYKSNQLNGEYTLVTDNSGGYEGDFVVKLDNGKWRVYRQEVEQYLGSSHMVYNDLETLESEWGETKKVGYTSRALSYVHDLSNNSEKYEYWHWTIFDFNNANGNNNNFTD